MKITELSLLGLFMVSLLTGCGSSSDSESESEPVVAVIVPPEEAPEVGGVVVGTTEGGAGTSAGPDSGAGPILIPGIDPIPLPGVDPTPDPIVIAPDPLSSLKGSWQYECTEDEDGGSQKWNLVYSQDSLHLFSSYYSDSACQNISARVEMSGQYVLRGATVLESGALVTYLSQDISSFQVAYYDSGTIFALNRGSICDSSTWSIGELKEIRDCSDFDLDYESFKKDIVSIENNQMVSGDFDFIGEDGYPTQLDDEILIKQSSTELEGEWLQDCVVSGVQGYHNELEVIGNSILLKAITYADANCDIELAVQTGAYFFELGEERILASGETVIEMTNTITSLHLSFNEGDFIELVNSENGIQCGATNWLESEFKDILDCSWVASSSDRVSRGVVKIDSDELTLGDNEYLDGDGFPTQLDADAYIRQD